MNPKDPQGVVTREEPQTGKKAYRKPIVQVYGTLAQVTNTGPHPAAIRVDGAAPPSTGNRT